MLELLDTDQGDLLDGRLFYENEEQRIENRRPTRGVRCAHRSLAAFIFRRSIIWRILVCFVAFGFRDLSSNTAGAAERSVNIAPNLSDRQIRKEERKDKASLFRSQHGQHSVADGRQERLFGRRGFFISNSFRPAAMYQSQPMVLTGDMQYTSATVSSSSAAGRGVPIKVVAVIVNRPYQSYLSVVKPNIQSIDQLQLKNLRCRFSGQQHHLSARERGVETGRRGSGQGH